MLDVVGRSSAVFDKQNLQEFAYKSYLYVLLVRVSMHDFKTLRLDCEKKLNLKFLQNIYFGQPRTCLCEVNIGNN